MAIDRLVQRIAGYEDISTRRLGDILLTKGLILPSQLADALEYQEKNGGRLGWILASLGYISRIDLYRALASHFRLPLICDIEHIIKTIDKSVAELVTPAEVNHYQVIPYRQNGEYIEVLTPEPNNPQALAFLQKRFGNTAIRQILITDLDIMKISGAVYRDEMLDKAIHGLFYRNPDESARRVLSRRQVAIISLLAGASAFAIYFNAHDFFIGALFLVQVFYLFSIVFKVFATWRGLRYRKKERRIEDEEPNLEYDDLPIYSVLIAAYREPAVIGTLIRAVNAIDYPRDKMDVILLLEEDDAETLDVAKREKPPSTWRFLTVPRSMPKTKPKALNYGVHFARGKYLTIYDAEDIPAPDQLKKSVAAFKSHGDNYICFQAALNYYNRNENFLTRMFTLEYSYWFDCFLPGLDAMKLPIPLGGTSNHFDVGKLKKIGAWDPFNVTEDADLGIRASLEGYKVGVIRSTTYEEANSKIKNWLRQRSRWVKGYMQTFLIHNRHPLKAIDTIGWKQWFCYNFLIGGTPALFLLYPVMWTIFIYYILVGGAVLDPVSMPPWLFYLAAINLFAGTGMTIWLNIMGIVPRKYHSLLPYTFLSPVYWLLQSAGAYKALWQLITRPSYWEKTNHGISTVTAVL